MSHDLEMILLLEQRGLINLGKSATPSWLLLTLWSTKIPKSFSLGPLRAGPLRCTTRTFPSPILQPPLPCVLWTFRVHALYLLSVAPKVWNALLSLTHQPIH